MGCVSSELFRQEDFQLGANQANSQIVYTAGSGVLPIAARNDGGAFKIVEVAK
jgi:hypothetical protein